jgi:CopG family nickel-responsive transcriptional regulator
MVGSGVSRISVSVSPDLLNDFDETIDRIGFTRSRAIQVAMRDFLTEYKWTVEQEGTLVGAITMIYDHEVRGLMETMTDVQHHHLGVISSTTHVHLDEHNCLEIIAFKGEVKFIRSLTEELMTTRGVKQLKLTTFKI